MSDSARPVRLDASSATPQRPGALDAEAAAAWESYNAMETTKQRHFALLERLDLKRSNYGIEPTPEETRLLADLLADHDAQVKRFTAASSALKQTDPAAHQTLFEYVGRILRSLETSEPGQAPSH